MKGIILAGGAGQRLFPLTQVVSKQLLTVYDKPMIYYPLSLLMLGGIRETLIITAPDQLDHFKKILGDGSKLGMKLEYITQDKPNGLPEAFNLGADFIGDDSVTLILGDNIFYGDIEFFRQALVRHEKRGNKEMGTIFAYPVADPTRYGVVEFGKNNEVLSLEEKPKVPKSRYAIPGLYIFDASVTKKAKSLKPSPRGETEIVDLMKAYLVQKNLYTEPITRGVAWLDTGTPQSLLEANQFIAAIEQRQGLKVACLEEIALRMKFINPVEYNQLVESYPNSDYRNYLIEIGKEVAKL